MRDQSWFVRAAAEYHAGRPLALLFDYDGTLTPIVAHPNMAHLPDDTRVYCVESVFFLRLYWERHPEHRARLLELLQTRRLRLLGASLTTPDTVLAHPESVMRDYLLGQEWLRSIGCDAFPRTAYFPDNFGHSPALAAITREGMGAILAEA